MTEAELTSAQWWTLALQNEKETLCRKVSEKTLRDAKAMTSELFVRLRRPLRKLIVILSFQKAS